MNWDPAKHPRHPRGSPQGGEFDFSTGSLVTIKSTGSKGIITSGRSKASRDWVAVKQNAGTTYVSERNFRIKDLVPRAGKKLGRAQLNKLAAKERKIFGL